MLHNRLLLIATLAGLGCTGCFMGPVASNQVMSTLSVSQAQCQMTVQNDSFAGLCAQIQINNTGVKVMNGWEIAFDLPASSHLQNSWNANFVVQGQHVVITPLASEGNLDVGGSVMLGYCASETGTNIVAIPGSCNDVQGTAITQDTNADASASQVASAESAAKTVVSQTHWQPLEGKIAGAPCAFAALATQPLESGVSLSLAPRADATLACAALISATDEAFDGTDLALQAAAQAGVVTSVGQTVRTASGLQGLVLRLGAADPTHAELTLWQDATPKRITLDMPATLTDGTHLYSWRWNAQGLRISVDDVVVYHGPESLADDLRAPRWVSTTPGHPSDEAFAP